MIEHDSTIIKCGLFLHLDGTVITEVLSKSELKKYEKGSVLIEKGSVPEALFIIRRGKVGIYNEDILLAELSELSIMGESFLAEATATATTVALTEVETIEIKKDDFFWLAIKHPRIVLNIFSINNKRLRTSNDAALLEARTREEKLKRLVEERTAELNITLEELRHTQKFRDQFLANMSHEIRTPMNAIVGLTNLLIKTPANELQAKYLGVIKKSGANLLVIINDILDLAKIEAGKMELEKVPFPLHIAIHNIQTILSLKAEEKGVMMSEYIGDGVPEYVVGDETRITQVIMNLAGNAIKFTEKGGVSVSVTVEKSSDEMVDLKFSVKDTGIGIPADKIDKIFESFGQASSDTTRKFGGTGLGLTISRQLVEMHKGTLNVKSTPGEGSEFYFIISYKPAAKPQEIAADESTSMQDMKGKRILLVEDNEFNQMVAVDTLHDIFEGLTIDIAENGKTAIEKVSANDYSMILMDIQLPDIDGFEITRFIRSEIGAPKNTIRICAMTASVTKERIDECFASGMNDYLMKPFSPDTLKEKVIKNALGVEQTTIMTRYDKTKQFMIDKLNTGLAETLYYHGVHHVLDVLASAEMIGEREKISVDDMELLKVSVLFHDSGFTVSAKNHEQIGCELAKENLPRFGYNEKEIKTICGMVMATQYPQQPKNHLEEIICDADLDYLGRDDFFSIGNSLLKEMNMNGEIKSVNDWNKLQEGFLSSHHYFTRTANELRNKKKQEHLEKIREMLKGI